VAVDPYRVTTLPVFFLEEAEENATCQEYGPIFGESSCTPVEAGPGQEWRINQPVSRLWPHADCIDPCFLVSTGAFTTHEPHSASIGDGGFGSDSGDIHLKDLHNTPFTPFCSICSFCLSI
jgi:hypothetical protein